MAKLVHGMIRVTNEARSLDFYSRAFGLEIAARKEFDSFVLIYLSNEESGTELELTVNKGREQPYDLGDGFGHFAFVVDDLDREYARFNAEGWNPQNLVELNHQGNALARFFFVQDPDGYKIEVIQRFGRFQ